MNIPAPSTSYDYSHSGYGVTTLRENSSGGPVGNDPWSNDGLEGSGAGQDYLQQYYQYRAMALQAFQNGALSPQEKATWQQYLSQLDQWLSQYQGASPTAGQEGWDPLTGNMGENSGPIPDYQDLNQMVFENGSRFSYTVDKKETREVHLYQTTTEVVIPSNAATAVVTTEPDNRMPGKTMAVITVTFTDGTTRKIYVHNIDRKDAKINVRAASVEQITLDSSATAFVDKIKASGLEEIPEEEMPGTPPDKTEEKVRTWNKNDSVDYYVTEGDEIDKIYADQVNITLSDRSQTAEVVKLGAHEYEVVIKDADGKVIRTIHLYQVDSVNFNGVDQDNLKFKDKTKGDGDFKAWSDPKHSADSQITLGGESTTVPEAGQALNPDSPSDTAPDTIDGEEAVYNKSQDVELTTYYGDDVKKHAITAPGTVTLHTSSYSDQVKITRLGIKEPYTYSIQVTNSKGETETYIVNGSSKIVIDALPGNVTYVSNEQALGPYTAGVDPKISVTGEPDKTTNNAGKTSSEISDALESAMGTVKQNLPLTWEGIDYGFVYNFVSEVFEAISNGMKTGDWSGLKKAISSLEAAAGNDQYRLNRIANGFDGLFMSLHSVLGEKKFKAVLAKLYKDDSDVFAQFKNGFSAGGPTNPINPYNGAGGYYWASGAWSESMFATFTHSQAQSFIDSAKSGE